jgi:Rrf2 family protein
MPSQPFLKVPRRVHNALLIVTDLAERHEAGAFVSLADIAVRERVSAGYLEEIAASLKTNGLIVGKRGTGGGYALARGPKEITIADVITAIEGPHALAVPGTDVGVAGILSKNCASWTVWNVVQANIAETLTGMTLADVLATRTHKTISV